MYMNGLVFAHSEGFIFFPIIIKSNQNWPKFERRICDVASVCDVAYAFATFQMHLTYNKYIKKDSAMIFAMPLRRCKC